MHQYFQCIVLYIRLELFLTQNLDDEYQFNIIILFQNIAVDQTVKEEIHVPVDEHSNGEVLKLTEKTQSKASKLHAGEQALKPALQPDHQLVAAQKNTTGSNHTASDSESEPESENESSESDYNWIPEAYFDKKKSKNTSSSTNNVGELHSYIELVNPLTYVEYT